jgi:hypothetical protein
MRIPRRLFLIAVLILCAAAEPARASWTRRYSPAQNVHDGLGAPLPGGALAFAVNGRPSGAILTIDSRGDVRAAREFGPHKALFISTTAAGEIYVGLGGEADEEWNARIVKLRSNLDVLWTRRVKPVLDGEPVHIRRGAATRDGGIVVIGTHGGGSLIVKLDSRGEVQWSTFLDKSGYDAPEAIRQTPDDGYVLATGAIGDASLAKLSPEGTLLWRWSYVRVGGITSLVTARDGAIICIGDAGGNAWIAKFDGAGNPVWSKISGRSGDGLSVVETAQGLAIAFRSGQSIRNGEARPIFHLALLRDDGSFVWQRSVEPGEHSPDLAYGTDHGAMLAPGARGLFFTLILRPDFAPLFHIDASGVSDCGWLVDRGGDFHDLAIRPEKRSIEVSRPGMVTAAADVHFLPLSVKAETERCAIGTQRNDALPEPKKSEDETSARYAELFLAGRFRELDAIAADFRVRPSPDPMRPYGRLRSFYGVMASDLVAAEETRLELLYRWVAEQPSITGRIALVNALYSAAWKRRGSGTADVTTATGFAEYREFMAKALDMLDCIGIEGESDPTYWTLRIGFAGQLGLEDVRDVARRALAIHTDPAFATVAGIYFEPQWGGSPAEVVAFVEDAAGLLAPAYGDAAYAWLAFRKKPNRTVVGSDEYRFDWSRIRKGFEDMIRIAPEWVPTYHIYAYMADQFRDRDVARELFERKELAWFEGAEPWWGRDHYDLTRRWALEIESVASPSVAPPSGPAGSMPIWRPPPVAPAPPPRPTPPKKWPLVIADSKWLLGENGHPGLPAFLIETSNGRLAVMLDVAARRAMPVRVANTRSRIEPLKVSAAPPLSRPVFVIACRRAEGKCTQVVLEARLFSMTKGREPDSPRRFQVAFAERPEAAIAGAAVVDESGAVFGLVIGEAAMWSPDWKFIVEVADVADAVPPPNS